MSAEQNGTTFRWSKASIEAARLVAEDKLSDEAIAEKCDIGRTTLARWKAHPEFVARVNAILEQTRAAIVRKGIADKQARIAILDDTLQRLRQVIAERAEDPQVAGVAGGKTGLVVPEPMLVKVYSVAGDEDDEELRPAKQSRIAYKYSVDTATIRELRETLKQAAQELGEWTEKKELTGKDGAPIAVTVFDLLKSASAAAEDAPS